MGDLGNVRLPFTINCPKDEDTVKDEEAKDDKVEINELGPTWRSK